MGLDHLIARVWTLTGAADAVTPEPIPSDGCVEIVFNLGDTFNEGRNADGTPRSQPRAVLVGPTIRPTVVAPTGRIDTLGVRLHPWAAGALLRISMSALADEVVELGAILPGSDRTLERAMITRDPAARFEILAEWLRPRGRRHPPAIAADLGALLGRMRREIPTAGWLASATGRTSRTIERVFASEVGIGPKSLGRVTRMQRALSLARSYPSATWSRIALDAGFYDQPHFNREFRQLVGGAPSDYGRSDGGLTQVFVEPVRDS